MQVRGQGTGGSTSNDEKAIWVQVMDEMDENKNREISYEEFRNSLFLVLQKNIDDSKAAFALKMSQRASICFDMD
jgi:hypothetical protein